MARFADDESTAAGDHRAPRAQRPGRRPPTLEQVRGPGSPHPHHLFLSKMVIGRSPQAQVVLNSASLSRQHLRLERRDGETYFFDLDSANGVFLNGTKAHSAILRDGDLLELGDCAFIFHERGL